MKNKTLIIAGGGPSGMMAAIGAAQARHKVALIEKNSHLGKKLLLTGKGRCNLTNAVDIESFFGHFSHNGIFLRDAFKELSNRDLMNFFEDRGAHLKVERQQRVFPASDKAADILAVLSKELKNSHVEIHYNCELQDVIVCGGKVEGVQVRGKKDIFSKAVILCTGGVSYPSTGSSGEGLKIAARLGHKIIDLKPGLIGLATKDKYSGRLQGLALKNSRITFSEGRKKITSETGELMFTDFGISGPLVLTLSGTVVDWIRAQKKVAAFIDLKPGLSHEQLQARLSRELKANPKKKIKNVLKDFLPLRLVDVFLEISGCLEDKALNQITRNEKNNLLFSLKALPLEITGSRPINMAMITRGGVSLKEINPKTMESRLIRGLYFAGEIIDADADTGGFNLQAAFSTGYLAGKSAAESRHS